MILGINEHTPVATDPTPVTISEDAALGTVVETITGKTRSFNVQQCVMSLL